VQVVRRAAIPEKAPAVQTRGWVVAALPHARFFLSSWHLGGSCRPATARRSLPLGGAGARAALLGGQRAGLARDAGAFLHFGGCSSLPRRPAKCRELIRATPRPRPRRRGSYRALAASVLPTTPSAHRRRQQQQQPPASSVRAAAATSFSFRPFPKRSAICTFLWAPPRNGSSKTSLICGHRG